jgi:hypothetical protein
MVLLGKEEKNGWMTVGYQSTWPLSYEVMLCAAQEIIDKDFKERLDRVAVGFANDCTECIDEVRKHNRILTDCPTVSKENGFLIVSGYSEIMESNIQIKFYNQTMSVILQTTNIKVFSESGDNAFSNYMNSIEINTYIKLANENGHIEIPIIKKPKSIWKKLFSWS